MNLLELWKHYHGFFSFAIEANGNSKIYISCHPPFTIIEVYPTMTTSTSENPVNYRFLIDFSSHALLLITKMSELVLYETNEQT